MKLDTIKALAISAIGAEKSIPFSPKNIGKMMMEYNVLNVFLDKVNI